MATTEEPNDLPLPDTLEYDPAFDYAEDTAVDEDWDEEDDAIDAEDNVVIHTPPVLPDEERPVPLDPDEFRGTE